MSFQRWDVTAPTTVGGTSTTNSSVCGGFRQGLQSGSTGRCQTCNALMDAFWGDRCGSVIDPFGHSWMVSTHKKDMSPEEMHKAAEEYMSKQHGPQ